MMSDITSILNETLKAQLSKNQLELVELFPIPLFGEKRVRIHTLEEVLQELDASQKEGAVGYFLQLKPKTTKIHSHDAHLTSDQTAGIDEEIHLADGRLNSLFLLKNADLLMKNGDTSAARSILNAILSSGDHAGVIHLKHAQCFEREQNLEFATRHYEKSIHYQPSFEAYHKLSTLLIQQGKNRDAAETLERALAQNALTPSIRFELHKAAGNCWTRVQNMQEAERNYKRALDLMPHADEIRSNLATLYLQGGNTTDAKRNFQDALASNPRNHQALSGLATCTFHEGNKILAHDYFIQSLEIDIHNPHALYYLVKCAYDIKTYTAAARLLRKFIERSPQHTSLIYTLAGLEFHLGQFDEAQAHVHQVLRIEPQHAGSLELLDKIQKFSNQNKIS